ncbi:DNA excision repair protein ERCC-6-like 2 [Astyanax mexicanus]|uniref:DNA excision repair protein ERCC-6-like 2 n=1 Tax=Astyanax mexicanus TaxID=7994 RepID=UPI0020CB03A4|nr:DNA excision repair protein ERCC-6-like 2 [Astyanax mexicanus]
MNAPFEDEKPLFHTNQKPPGPSEPFVLSKNGHQVPYTINRYLRDYQRDGVKFIYDRYMKSRGCILGDDMGLGKTVQVISFLAAVLQKTGTWEDVENNRPDFLQSQRSCKQSKLKKVFLIVAPLSVLYNWKDELDTWGHFKTVVVHGVKKEEELTRVNRGKCEIALTTYETLRLCLDQFNSIDWAAVIVDEAHKLKNSKSQITQAMKEMKCKVRVGLTGTILQNNLEELWCVMDWAIPGCLGSLGCFKNRFSDPIEQGQKHSVTKRALAEGRKAVQTLAKRLSRWFLRRTKALISDQLPRKDDRVVYCSLTDFQQTVYRAVLDTNDVKLLLQSSARCHCGSGRTRKKCCHKFNSDGVPVRHMYFSYLAILRKVANHVAVLQTKEGTSKKQEKYVADICEQVFKKFPEFMERCKQAAFEAMSDPIYSGKMKVLQRLMNHFIKRKDKILLFSMSTKLLDVLESYCMAEGLEYRRLDGTTKAKDRVHIVKEFNSSSDINLCLVSTMAGGLGLNFVGANVVVLFDPTWNPANDLQAIDRAYRIGQCKDVTVFRLISLGTVEEIIYLRQIYKQQLQSSVIGMENARRYFEAVQGAEGQAGELFGIRNLFRLQTDGTCLTHRILEREGRIEVGIKTARTQATEERMREPDPVPLSGDAEQAGSSAGTRSTSARHADAGVLDFSSASEDEDPCSSRSKATDANAGDEPGAGTGCGNMGLSALLQKHAAHRAQRGSDSSDESETEGNWEGWDPVEPQAAEKKGAQARWALSSDSEEERGKAPGKRVHSSSAKPADHHAVDHHVDMEDSEDLNIPQKTNTKARQKQKHSKFTVKRHEEEIESFTSSEDEAPVRKMSKSKTGVSHASSPHYKKTVLGPPLSMQSAARKLVKFTGLKSPITQTRDSTANSTGTIDTLLGGLQEVSYSHSNQKVVGSSRTENRLSRAALRDVFELKKHSQLPANHLLDISQTQSGNTQSSNHTPTDGGRKDSKQANHDRPHLQHQVSHFIRTSHHTQNATISVGETPAAFCKQQMEEMARFFRAKSVQEFAEELVSSTSAERLAKLRGFYSHRNPELSDLIKQTFPKPENKPKAPVTPASSTSTATRHRTTSKRTLSDSALRPLHEEEEAEEDRKGRETMKKNRASNAESALNPNYRSNGQTRQGRKSRILSPEASRSPTELPHSPSGTDIKPQNDILTRTERNPGLAQVTRPSKDKPSTSSELPSSSRAAEPGGSQPTKNLITDLIGDTSILDDLFKPKRSADRPKPAPAPIPSPTERTKNRGKDFWDILNEGNEESINKLTDLTQVEKFCRSVSVSGRSKSESSLESSQLWKKNEKFIWKR